MTSDAADQRQPKRSKKHKVDNDSGVSRYDSMPLAQEQATMQGTTMGAVSANEATPPNSSSAVEPSSVVEPSDKGGPSPSEKERARQPKRNFVDFLEGGKPDPLAHKAKKRRLSSAATPETATFSRAATRATRASWSPKESAARAARAAADTAESMAQQSLLAKEGIAVVDFAYVNSGSGPLQDVAEASGEESLNETQEPAASVMLVGRATPGAASPTVSVNAPGQTSPAESSLANRKESRDKQAQQPIATSMPAAQLGNQADAGYASPGPSVPTNIPGIDLGPHSPAGSSSRTCVSAPREEPKLDADQDSVAPHKRVADLRALEKPKGVHKRRKAEVPAPPPRRSGYNLRSGRKAVAQGDQDIKQEEDGDNN